MKSDGLCSVMTLYRCVQVHDFLLLLGWHASGVDECSCVCLLGFVEGTPAGMLYGQLVGSCGHGMLCWQLPFMRCGAACQGQANAFT